MTTREVDELRRRSEGLPDAEPEKLGKRQSGLVLGSSSSESRRLMGDSLERRRLCVWHAHLANDHYSIHCAITHAARLRASRRVDNFRARKGAAMIKGIKFVNIPIKDQERALAFYTERLGFTVATDQPMGPAGQRWIE